MAHDVYQINGEDSMAFAGDTPWHGLGQKIEWDSPIEVWAQQAHLDWTVAMTPVEYRIDDERFDYRERSVIYREDSNQPLAVVSSDYKPVQPGEVLEFFRETVDKAGFKIETAGSLKGGKRVWALANTGRELNLGGRSGSDPVLAYLLLATSYDTTLRTTAAITAVRVVCNNTLSLAYERTEKEAANGSPGVVKISHRSNFDIASVHKQLGLLDNTWADFSLKAAELTKRKVTDEEAVSFFINLYHNRKLADDYSDVPKRTIAQLLSIFKDGVGSKTPTAAGTAWGLVNSVTRFYDHERKSRSVDNRLDAAWFGDGAGLKARAWADSLELLNAA